ncbi:MAG: site-2 protease family protein [Gemmatimonadota bacterium]|nr:site-2 protease family protein [Gemmatimonadota bacterium]
MTGVLVVAVLIASVVLHELAHAWVADREGDDTARRQGRITLNPISHLDPIGSVLVPLVLFTSTGGGSVFGWARPVPIVPSRFRDPVWSDIKVSLAGVAANLLLVPVAALVAIVAFRLEPLLGVAVADGLVLAAGLAIQINLTLALFNLLPIPPLDGSHVVYHLLPRKARPAYRSFGRYGILALMVLLLLVPGALDVVFTPVAFLTDLTHAFIRLWI